MVIVFLTRKSLLCAAVALAATGAACGAVDTVVSGSTDTASTTTAVAPSEVDGEIALLLLPGLSAAESLLTDTTTSSTSLHKTVGTYNASLPATPAACANQEGGCTQVATNTYRFPATGYIQDFYGTSGNQAYMTLEAVSDNWGEYKVSLYVYPTTSTSVQLVTEVYRVNGTSWDNLIDETTGATNAVAFESITTRYFDARLETRTVIWSRWVDNLAYPLITMPTSFDDSAWDYDSLIEPTKEAVGDLGGQQDYSSQTTSTISSDLSDCTTTKHYCITETGTEYYTEIPNADGVLETSSQSRGRRTITYMTGELKDLSIDADTVRMYTIDAAGLKTVKAKTVQTYTVKKETSTTTTTELIIVGDTDDDALTNYASTVTATSTESKNDKITTFSYTSLLALEETTSGSNIYAGTYDVTYTEKNGKEKIYAYTAQLDIHGLTYTEASSNLAAMRKAVSASTSEPSFTFTTRDHYAADATPTAHSIVLDSGTLADAIYQGGLLLDGTMGGHDVMVGEGFLIYQTSP